MTTITTIYDRAWPGHPMLLQAGQTATATAPAGCQLRRSVSGEWQDVASPFTATEPTSVRIDCDIHNGTLMQATLEITG